jgi:hypothetical protein
MAIPNKAAIVVAVSEIPVVEVRGSWRWGKVVGSCWSIVVLHVAVVILGHVTVVSVPPVLTVTVSVPVHVGMVDTAVAVVWVWSVTATVTSVVTVSLVVVILVGCRTGSSNKAIVTDTNSPVVEMSIVSARVTVVWFWTVASSVTSTVASSAEVGLDTIVVVHATVVAVEPVATLTVPIEPVSIYAAVVTVASLGAAAYSTADWMAVTNIATIVVMVSEISVVEVDWRRAIVIDDVVLVVVVLHEVAEITVVPIETGTVSIRVHVGVVGAGVAVVGCRAIA